MFQCLDRNLVSCDALPWRDSHNVQGCEIVFHEAFFEVRVITLDTIPYQAKEITDEFSESNARR